MNRWRDDLATGISAVDEQHKEMFRRIDGLLQACQEGKGREKVGGMIDFLGGYVARHFKDEESLQISSGYPGHVSHKKLHGQFLADFGRFKKKFDSEGPSLTLVMGMNKFLVEWAVNHIEREDKAMAEYIREKAEKVG